MHHEPIIPPLASPHGAGIVPPPEQQEPNSLRVIVQLRPAAVCRYAVIEWLTPTVIGLLFLAPLLMSLAVFPIEVRRSGLAALPIMFVIFALSTILLSAPSTFLLRLCSRRCFDIEISAAGITKRYPNRNIFFPWRKFIWVVERNGDLWLASVIDGCFIPRESFASREESHEVALFLRELKGSDGADWRPEWKGRVFGLQPEAGDALSIPR